MVMFHFHIYIIFYSIIELLFPPVDADSNVDTTKDNTVTEILEETVDKKKKKPKQKVGFRDRKVLHSSNINNINNLFILRFHFR